MCKSDIRHYFDNKVNNEKLEAEIIELKQELCKLTSDLLLKDKLILVLQGNLTSTEGRLNESRGQNKERNILISTLKAAVVKLKRK